MIAQWKPLIVFFSASSISPQQALHWCVGPNQDIPQLQTQLLWGIQSCRILNADKAALDAHKAPISDGGTLAAFRN